MDFVHLIPQAFRRFCGKRPVAPPDIHQVLGGNDVTLRAYCATHPELHGSHTAVLGAHYPNGFICDLALVSSVLDTTFVNTRRGPSLA